MSKRRKIEKNILNKFKDIDNETLLLLLKEEISQYSILKKSENKAIEILNKYNIKPNTNLHKNTKRYQTLLQVANLRNLKVPKEWYNIEITDNDIILRINEFKNTEITWIKEHNYLLDAFYEENLPNNEYSILNSEEKISQIAALYEDIIIKEFGSPYKYIKKKKN